MKTLSIYNVIYVKLICLFFKYSLTFSIKSTHYICIYFCSNVIVILLLQIKGAEILLLKTNLLFL